MLRGLHELKEAVQRVENPDIRAAILMFIDKKQATNKPHQTKNGSFLGILLRGDIEYCLDNANNIKLIDEIKAAIEG